VRPGEGRGRIVPGGYVGLVDPDRAIEAPLGEQSARRSGDRVEAERVVVELEDDDVEVPVVGRSGRVALGDGEQASQVLLPAVLRVPPVG